jgi:hypothetical protein
VPEPELTDILDRVALGRADQSDLETLRSRIELSGDKNRVQVGQYNVDISGGRSIHIGEQVYQGANADTIRSIIREIVGEPEPTPSRLYITIIGLAFIVMVAAFVVFGFTLFTSGNQDPDAGMPPGIPIAGAMFGGAFVVAIVASVIRAIVNPGSLRSGGRGRSWD